MPILEKNIEAKFVRECKARGWLCLKQNVIGRRGYPDRLIIKPGGVHVWVEFKKPGGKLSENQKAEQEKLEKMGCIVATCFDADQAINFVEYVK